MTVFRVLTNPTRWDSLEWVLTEYWPMRGQDHTNKLYDSSDRIYQWKVRIIPVWSHLSPPVFFSISSTGISWPEAWWHMMIHDIWMTHDDIWYMMKDDLNDSYTLLFNYWQTCSCAREADIPDDDAEPASATLVLVTPGPVPGPVIQSLLAFIHCRTLTTASTLCRTSPPRT